MRMGRHACFWDLIHEISSIVICYPGDWSAGDILWCRDMLACFVYYSICLGLMFYVSLFDLESYSIFIV